MSFFAWLVGCLIGCLVLLVLDADLFSWLVDWLVGDVSQMFDCLVGFVVLRC